MKVVILKSLRHTCLLLLITSSAAFVAHAQDVKLQLGNLDKLEARASDSVDVTLDGQMLRLAGMFLDAKKPDQAAVKDLLSGLKGVYVKVFNFEKEGEYSAADIDSVRTQLRAPGWSRMVGVKSKHEGDNVEVYTILSGSQINGMAVIAADPKQLTVINIVGVIDLEKLVKLSGKFGIPSLDINTGNKEPKE
ncbi:MAG: hypothetical protein QOJ02_3335 [Acidobacteriota bacterium]|jgi:hypothetical protein|nr:hypothetical protein [Acidobacteriota bacterium]